MGNYCTGWEITIDTLICFQASQGEEQSICRIATKHKNIILLVSKEFFGVYLSMHVTHFIQ